MFHSKKTNKKKKLSCSVFKEIINFFVKLKNFFMWLIQLQQKNVLEIKKFFIDVMILD